MITSTQNAKVKHIRGLQSQTKARRESGQYVIEGVRLVEEALHQDQHPELILYTDSLDPRGRESLKRFTDQDVPAFQVNEEVFQAASDTETPQGILAVLQQPRVPDSLQPNLAVITDQIRDPGNLGTILRTALAAGADLVLMPPGTVDAYSPKVVRAGMGAHFQLALESADWDQIRRRTNGLQVFCADMDRGIPLWNADLTRPAALIIGSEAHGPGPEARELTDTWLHIPMPGRTESLNAAAAAAVLLFEAVRQRSGQKGSSPS